MWHDNYLFSLLDLLYLISHYCYNVSIALQLSEQRFAKLTATMEQEQEENQRRLQELMRMLQQSDAQESEVRTFIREIRQYATI